MVKAGNHGYVQSWRGERHIGRETGAATVVHRWLPDLRDVSTVVQLWASVYAYLHVDRVTTAGIH